MPQRYQRILKASSSTGESKSASLEKKSECRPPVKPQKSPSWIYLVNPFLTIAFDFHNRLISFVSVIDQTLFWLHSNQLAASLFQSHFVQTSSDFGLFPILYAMGKRRSGRRDRNTWYRAIHYPQIWGVPIWGLNLFLMPCRLSSLLTPTLLSDSENHWSLKLSLRPGEACHQLSNPDRHFSRTVPRTVPKNDANAWDGGEHGS